MVALLDKNNFPWDAIYLDGDHTDGYRWFHWNSTTYTNPVEMLNNISATGRVAVSISDPHIKVEDSYDVYIGAKEKYFTKWKNGSNYEGNTVILISLSCLIFWPKNNETVIVFFVSFHITF